MARVHEWWRSLTGQGAKRAELSRPGPRTRRSAKPSAGLELADEVPQRQPSRGGGAGFDPYASDAGYAKPHSWERVDHD
jgi:hypothetical protein